MDDLTRGMSFQPEKASDQFFDAEVGVSIWNIRRQSFIDNLSRLHLERNSSKQTFTLVGKFRKDLRLQNWNKSFIK